VLGGHREGIDRSSRQSSNGSICHNGDDRHHDDERNRPRRHDALCRHSEGDEQDQLGDTETNVADEQHGGPSQADQDGVLQGEPGPSSAQEREPQPLETERRVANVEEPGEESSDSGHSSDCCTGHEVQAARVTMGSERSEEDSVETPTRRDPNPRNERDRRTCSTDLLRGVQPSGGDPVDESQP
jgi:hypothetical protein